MDKPSRPTHPLKKVSSRLENLVQRAETHEVLESLIISYLPDSVRDRCRFASIRNGELTLMVPSSALASQLRFQQRQLLPQLRQEPALKNIWRIRVRVSPPSFSTPRTAPKRHLSHENARLLESEAGQTEDRELRKILLQLAGHGTGD